MRRSGLPSTKAAMYSFRRFVSRPFHPPDMIAYSFLLGRRFLPGNVRSLLEIGCGIGAFALRFAAEHPAARVVAIDHSTDLIEYLASKSAYLYPNLRLVALDFCDEAQNLGTFHALYSSDVLEHVCDVPRFIRNGYCALKAGGIAVVNFPNHDDHGINHFVDTQSLTEAFDMFSETEVYDVVISGLHEKTYYSLRKLYERLLSRDTEERRAALCASEQHGVDYFQDSACFEFVRSRTAMNAAANIMSALILAFLRPRFSIRPIQGPIRNRNRIVVVARK